MMSFSIYLVFLLCIKSIQINHGFMLPSSSFLSLSRTSSSIITTTNTHPDTSIAFVSIQSSSLSSSSSSRYPINTSIKTKRKFTLFDNRRAFDDYEYYDDGVDDRRRGGRQERQQQPMVETNYKQPFSSSQRIRSREEQELRNMKYEDDYYEDEEEDDDEPIQESGNFWSNPKGTMDDYDNGNKRNGQPRTRSLIRSDDEDRRRRDGSRSRAREDTFDDYDDDYDDDYGERSRNRKSQRKTFRSGTPPPPNILKGFYDQLFWYGFDPDDTTTTSESRTMFGGTKGKFDGLGLLSDIQQQEQQKQRRGRGYDNNYDDDEGYDDYDDDNYRGGRRRDRGDGLRQSRFDNDDDTYYYDDEYDEYYNEGGKRRNENMSNERRNTNYNNYEEEYYVEVEFDDDNDEDDYDYYEYNQNKNDRSNDATPRPVPNASLLPSQRRPSLPQPLDDNDYTTADDVNNNNDDDNVDRVLYSSSYRTERSEEYYIQRQSNDRKRNRKKNRDPNYDEVDDNVGDEWRRSGRREGGRRRKRRSKKSSSSPVSTWFIDDEKEETKAWMEQKRKEQQEGRRSNEPSPIINLLDTVFQVDSEEVKYQADDYNRKLGLDKKSNNSDKRGQNDATGRETTRRRKGYAYRYSSEEDDNYDDDFSYKKSEDEEEFREGVANDSRKKEYNTFDNGSSSSNSNIIDVEATVQSRLKSTEGANSNRNDRQLKKQSWEDRAQAYEQVPPKTIKAWGPEGVIDGGIDIRTYSARNALEEISKARNTFEKKEEMVNVAENDLIQLKRDASSLKKRLLSRDNPSRSSSIRDRLRMINFDIEDSARRLRRAKGEALAAIDRLEALELRHWALLRQYEADQTLIREDNLSNPTSVDDSNKIKDETNVKVDSPIATTAEIKDKEID